MKLYLPDLKKLMCVLAHHKEKMIERKGKFSKGVKNVGKFLLVQKGNSYSVPWISSLADEGRPSGDGLQD